jgi:quercetin dioxygenase-like cupin family protein
MMIKHIPFGITNWNEIDPTHHAGVTGSATWQTQMFGDIRVRMVKYTPGYEADHWCSKGHIVLCLEGELESQHQNGQSVFLKAGLSYQVGDNVMPHRWKTQLGATVFIVD